MKKITLLFVLAVSLFACGTAKRTSVLNYATPLKAGETVEVTGIGQSVPAGAKLIGQIKIADSGFTFKCTYAEVVSQAQEQARGMGANLIQITKHKEPGLGSTCHRIEADAYLVK